MTIMVYTSGKHHYVPYVVLSALSSPRGSRYDSTVDSSGNQSSERLSIQSFDKQKLITYYGARHCAKDCACFTANITRQEERGLDPESLVLVPGFFCSMSHTLKKSTQKFQHPIQLKALTDIICKNVFCYLNNRV